ncbi:MAG: hypothetical protein LBG05_00595 [Treponema sp.]|jgi:hypothetical protein|nr:hypothetical protein [Treponema sp.]
MSKKQRKDVLSLACTVGFAFAAIACAGLIWLLISQKLGKDTRDETNFSQILLEFDESFETLIETGSVQRISAALNLLEKQAVSVESLLSVLKRYRKLAQKDDRFISSYQKSTQSAAARYPASQPLAVVAAESLLWGMDFNAETIGLLRSYAARMIQGGLTKSALSIYVLLGDMDNPEKASTVPGGLFDLENRRFDADNAILSILKGDTAAASVQINAILMKKDVSQTEKKLAAEFFYHYGKPSQAAEIFSQFPGEDNMLRQADALYISGNEQNARNVWTLLLSSQQNYTKIKSLYNLAVTETDGDRKRDYLEQLAEILKSGELKNSVYELYGILHYSRLLSVQAAMELIDRVFMQGEKPLADLERIKRGREIWTQDKMVAQVWFLLNAYQKNESLYQWAAWFFDFERRYNETDMLIENAAFNDVAGDWLILHEAIGLISHNEIASARELLESVPPEHASWTIFAVLGRIYEMNRSRESIEKAVDYYKKASLQNADKSVENAARLQYRLSRCFRFLGRDVESKAALETAIKLQPDYLDAMTELKRMRE